MVCTNLYYSWYVDEGMYSPLIYILLTGKRQSDYVKGLDKSVVATSQCSSPEYIIPDFEIWYNLLMHTKFFFLMQHSQVAFFSLLKIFIDVWKTKNIWFVQRRQGFNEVRNIYHRDFPARKVMAYFRKNWGRLCLTYFFIVLL